MELNDRAYGFARIEFQKYVCLLAGSIFLECAADEVFTTLPIKFTIQTIEWSGYEKVRYVYQTNKYFAG